MTIYLDEDWAGIEDDIVYPNVQSCVALAVSSTNANLAGMHMTIGTKALTLQRVGELIRGLIGGPIASVVCVGNLQTFKGGNRDQGMIYKHGLAKTLRAALNWTGTVYGYDTSEFYQQGRGGNYDGIVVRFWRPIGAAQVHYAVGPKTAWARNGSAVVNTPIFNASSRDMVSVDNQDFGRVRVIDKTGKSCPAYTIQDDQLAEVDRGRFKSF